MKLNELSNTELVAELKALVETERDASLKVIEHLRELDDRKLYRDLGFSSLFAYCTGELQYSEAAAHRRITAARYSKEHPEVLNMLRAKELNLSTLCVIAPVINQENKTELLMSSKAKPKAFVEKLASQYKPIESKPDRIKFVTIARKETSENMDLFAQSEHEHKNYFRSGSASKVSFSFQADEEFLNKFNRTKELLSGKYPKGACCEELFSEALEVFLDRHCPVRRAEKMPARVALRKQVFLKDNCQCSYVSPDGKRCMCKNNLEVDHILPRAKGGKNELSNLRLLCSAHNKLMAERHLGKEFMQQFY